MFSVETVDISENNKEVEQPDISVDSATKTSWFGRISQKVSQQNTRLKAKYINFKTNLRDKFKKAKKTIHQKVFPFANPSNVHWNRFSKLYGGISNSLRKASMVYIFLFLTILFIILTQGRLLDRNNIESMIRSNSYIIFIAMGMFLVILTGNIDLSVGSVMGMIGSLAVSVTNSSGFAAAFIVAILTGMAVGMLHGILVAYAKIPSFIVTLGGMLVWRGVQFDINKGTTLVMGDKGDPFLAIVLDRFPDVNLGTTRAPIYIVTIIIFILLALVICTLMLTSYITRMRYEKANQMNFEAKMKSFKLGAIKFNYDPNFISLILKSIVTLAVFAFLAWLFSSNGLKYYLIMILLVVSGFYFLTTKTVYGRKMYAVGGNIKAAHLSGISVKKHLMSAFLFSGLMSGIAGIVYTSGVTNASPTAGNGFELNVISAVYVGGVSASGGVGTITGVALGWITIAVIETSILLNGYPQQYKDIIKGAVLVLAVAYDIFARRKAVNG